MYLRDLAVSCSTQYFEKDPILGRQFNIEANCIEHMFLKNLGKIYTGNFGKAVIEVYGPYDEIYGSVIEDLIDVMRVNIFYNFDEYWNSNELGKKKIILELIYKGLIMLFNEYGFNKTVLDKAYNEIKDSNYKTDFYLKFIKSSPNRKYKARIYAEYGLKYIKLYFVVLDKNGNKIKIEFITKTESDHILVYPILGSIKWLDNNTLVLLNREKKIVKEINI